MPNLNITFRSRALDPERLCRPAVHYWIVGRSPAGIMGPLDRAGTSWTIVQGVADPESVDPVSMVLDLCGGPIDVEVLATDPWSARTLLVDRYAGRRIFLVGDAAHLNPPWGGHGFNTSVGDAVNLAWKMAAVLRGHAGAPLLDSYEIERRPVARQTLSAAGAQEAFLAPAFGAAGLDADTEDGCRLRDRVAHAIRVAKHSEFYSLGLVLGDQYPVSPIVWSEHRTARAASISDFTPSAHPGARLPHAWLGERRSIYDLLGAEFSIISFSVSSAPFLAAAARRGISMTAVDLAAWPHLRGRYGAELVLVRPDQHVAWRGNDASGAGQILGRALGDCIRALLFILSPACRPAMAFRRTHIRRRTWQCGSCTAAPEAGSRCPQWLGQLAIPLLPQITELRYLVRTLRGAIPRLANIFREIVETGVREIA